MSRSLGDGVDRGGIVGVASLGVGVAFEQAGGQIGRVHAGSVVQGRVAAAVAGIGVGSGFEKALDRFLFLAGDRENQRGSAVLVAGFKVGALAEELVNPGDGAVLGRAVQGRVAVLVRCVDVSGFGHRE